MAHAREPGARTETVVGRVLIEVGSFLRSGGLRRERPLGVGLPRGGDRGEQGLRFRLVSLSCAVWLPVCVRPGRRRTRAVNSVSQKVQRERKKY